MLRINQLMNSPIRSPQMNNFQTQNLKKKSAKCQDGMIMRTPVMTGRVQSVDSKGGCYGW